MKGLAKSNIGYKGIGADGRPVTWMYGWNPGGFGCSNLEDCPGCWSHSMCHRSACPDCAAFKVHMHPERLGQPAATKKPGIVLCNFVNDWLDTKRSFFDSETIVGCMVPPHIYVTLTKQAIRLSHLVGEMPCLRDDFSGLTIRNQADADAKLTTFLGIQGNLWLSLEPLWGPVDFGDTWWETSDACGHGNVRGIIIGHDNRRGAPGTDTLNHVRSVVKQCQAAGIPVYVKQLWLPRGKAKGGLSKDVKDFPSDLQLRNLPWSSPK